jgi:DNA-binding Lrp family transcriptional regulator
MYTSIYHTNLGLRKAVVVLKARSGMEQLLFDCLLVNGFWLYVCRSYGAGEGCTAVYAVPVERCSEFEEFVNEIGHLGVAEDVQVFWSTCFQGGRITSDWFDNRAEGWVCRWDDWVREVQTQTTDLPYTLMEAESYPVLADDIDVKMLMKLEKDATASISEVGRLLGMSRQLAAFHYRKHLMGRKLIEGYEIFVMRYAGTEATMVLFLISFPDYEKFAKFARSLLDKFFVITMGKVLGKNALLLEVFLSTSEFRKFVGTLSTMARMKLVQNYEYAVQDFAVKRRQTISGEYFKDGSWIYDHKNHLETLKQKIANNAC